MGCKCMFTYVYINHIYCLLNGDYMSHIMINTFMDQIIKYL